MSPPQRQSMALISAELGISEPIELSGYCRERDLYREQVERWRQASQDANERPVLTSYTQSGELAGP